MDAERNIQGFIPFDKISISTSVSSAESSAFGELTHPEIKKIKRIRTERKNFDIASNLS